MTARTATKSAPRAAKRATAAESTHSKVHVAQDYVLGAGPDSAMPRFQWVRVVCGAITSLLVGCGLAAGFGWMTEMLMIGVAAFTGSMVAAMAIYYLGIVLMMVASFMVLPKVWDHVVSGRTEEAIAIGWSKAKGWFARAPKVAA